MKKKFLTGATWPLLALALVFSVAGCSHPQPVVYSPPPPELSQIAQRGFHDGIRAAHRDLSRGLPPNVDRHPLFRNPPVPYGPPAEDYRVGFRRGYRRAYRNAAGN